MLSAKEEGDFLKQRRDGKVVGLDPCSISRSRFTSGFPPTPSFPVTLDNLSKSLRSCECFVHVQKGPGLSSLADRLHAHLVHTVHAKDSMAPQ